MTPAPRLTTKAERSDAMGVRSSARCPCGHRRSNPFALDLVPDQRRKRRLLDRRDIGTPRRTTLGEKPLDDPEFLGAARADLEGRSNNAPHRGFAELDELPPDRRRVSLRRLRREGDALVRR